MGRSSTRVATFLLACFLGSLAGVAPALAPSVLAAGDLRFVVDTTYTLDPDAGRVHVEIDVALTNQKPNAGSFIYFYRDMPMGLQPEARNIRAADSSGRLGITTRQRKNFVEASVHLRANVYYGQTARFTIRYDLVGGAPRSDTPTRIGAAFSTFGVWAWGDPGRASVEVRIPDAFEFSVDGGPLSPGRDGGTTVLTANPKEPDEFFAIVSAENRDAYASTRLSLPGDVEVVVRGWPEDEAWTKSVTGTLRLALPELQELIGLEWPVDHDLDVRERYTPALEGYAGIFFVDDQRIDVSEDLDPVVIVHEASHAWLNQDLFAERWIYEGLAEEYAWRVQTSVGGESGPGPERPLPDDPGELTLVAWTFPQVIRDQATDDRERYGYGTSFWVIHQIVEEAGVDTMRAAFEAAQKNLTAYPGAGTRETVAGADDWRRLLDLVQRIDQSDADADAIEGAITTYAITKIDARALPNRAAAREQYRALLEAGGGWLPPWYVRNPMGTWTFVGASKAMDAAEAVLAKRDEVAAAAAALGLEPDDALRLAYESATTSLAGAEDVAADQLVALAAIGDARAKVEAEPDLLTRIGLIGEAPRRPYDEARAAFERGDLDAAVAAAGSASNLIGGAAAIGQGRLLTGVAIAVGVVILLVVLALVGRQIRRRRRLTIATATAVAASGAIVPNATELHLAAADAAGAAPAEPVREGWGTPGTLTADPDDVSAPPSASVPDREEAPG